jgi:tripartite-type tricarboxylate transporter receptor subunit TctC
VPANIEAGLPTFDTAAWTGLFLPAGTPAVVVARLSAALQVVLRKPAVVQRLEACCSARMFPNTPAEFDEFLKQERIGWAQKIKAAGIQPE